MDHYVSSTSHPIATDKNILKERIENMERGLVALQKEELGKRERELHDLVSEEHRGREKAERAECYIES